MALIIPSNYHKISDVEKNHISWIEPELAKRQDIRPLRIGILNIMPLGKQYEFNLLQLNWNGTELVVVSGCESGQGDLQSGEGVYGLKRAIAVAGAAAPA